jgi:hypothetical protein
MDAVGKFYAGIENDMDAAQAFMENWQKKASECGFDLWQDGAEQSGKAGAFSTMTQEQGTKLERLFTSVQMHTANIDSQLKDIGTTMYAASDTLIRIEANTAYCRNAMKTEKKKFNPDGRKSKADPCRHRYSFNLNDADNAQFLAFFDASRLKDKAHFITACIFKRELKVVKVDKAAMDYYMRLTTFLSQFRAIGTNYNQVTKAIKSTFTEKKALAFLYKLEKATIELVTFHNKIQDLTKEFEEKWLQK